MKTLSVKTLLLAAFGVSTLCFGTVAQAQVVPVEYEGHTTLRANSSTASTTLQCYLTLTGTYDTSTGAVIINSGSVQTDPDAGCAAIVLTGLAWSGTDEDVADHVGALKLEAVGAEIPGALVCEGEVTGAITVDHSNGPAPAPVPDNVVLSNLPIQDPTQSLRNNCVIDGTLTYSGTGA